ncbi:MAG: NrsF family protein [Geminicoccaceae bacterium]
MRTTEQLIDQLAATVVPVVPLKPALLRAVGWLALSAAIVAGIVLSHGVRPDLAAQFARPVMAAEWLGAVLTGVLAAVATFQVSLPGRSRRWLLLPLPGLTLWLGALCLGCLADWFRHGPAAWAVGPSWSCVQAILTTSLPLGIALLVMVRHAGLVRPGATALVGGLAVAALSAAGLSLYHHVDTALMVLIWHGGAVALVVCAAWGVSERLFAWIGPARA